MSNYVKKPVHLQYCKTYNELVLGYGVIFDCTSEELIKPIFLSQKNVMSQICTKARSSTTADFCIEINVINVYDFYTVELPIFSNEFVVFYQLNILTRFMIAT